MPIMENSKHTPGPWKIMPDPRQRSGDWARWTLLSEKGSLLTFTGVDQKGDQGAANARLIAAAPDLYESLKGFLEHVLHNYDLTERENKKFAELANSGLAAITKAETV